jgi:hypothetical protein
MKSTLLLIFALLINTAKSQSDSLQYECLKVVGVALNSAGKPLPGIQVRLLRQNEELEWLEVTSADHHDHTFQFTLVKNEHYSIEISREGCLTRLISIDTRMPDDVTLEQLFRYEFEIEMLKEKPVQDDFYLDFPLALISYDKKHSIFSFSEEYTKHIKQQLKTTAGYTNNIHTISN